MTLILNLSNLLVVIITKYYIIYILKTFLFQAGIDNLGRLWTWGNGLEKCLCHGDDED